MHWRSSPAIGDEHGSGNKRSLVGSKKQAASSNLFGLRDSAQRNALRCILEFSFNGRCILGCLEAHLILAHCGPNPARRHSIGTYVVRAACVSKRTGIRNYRGLARRITCTVCAQIECSYRRNIDDRSAPLPHHQRQCGTAHHHCSGHVDGKSTSPDFIEDRFGTIWHDDTCTVDDNVQLLTACCDRSVDVCLLCDVAVNRARRLTGKSPQATTCQGRMQSRRSVGE